MPLSVTIIVSIDLNIAAHLYTLQFREQYKVWTQLCDNSGFGFNSERKLPTAPPEVWEAYLVKHPKAEPFRHATLLHIHDLQTLFEGNLATGRQARASGTMRHLGQALTDNLTEPFPCSPRSAGYDRDDDGIYPYPYILKS